MRLREHASTIVELDRVRERNIASAHPHRSRDAHTEVGFDRAAQRVVHLTKATRSRDGGTQDASLFSISRRVASWRILWATVGSPVMSCVNSVRVNTSTTRSLRAVTV